MQPPRGAQSRCPHQHCPHSGVLAPPRAPHSSPGVTGFLRIDENGDRENDYTLWDMDPTSGDFQVGAAPGWGNPTAPQGRPDPPFPPLHPTQMVANYNGTTKELHMVPGRDIHWPGNVVPSDVPPCGFDHSDPQCRKGERWMGGGTTRGGPQPLTTPPLTLQPT